VSATRNRRAVVAGIASVVLFAAGAILTFSDTSEVKKSDSAATAAQKRVHELSSSGHRVGLLIGACVLIVAAILFIWFCNGLRERIVVSAMVGRAISSLAVLGAGAISVAALLGGAGVAGDVEFAENALPESGEVLPVTGELFYPFVLVALGLASAALIATIAASSARAGGIPRWLAYAGWLGALGSILGVIFILFVLPLLWYLAVAIVGPTRAGPGGHAQPAPGV
jgi:hypothetical protein